LDRFGRDILRAMMTVVMEMAVTEEVIVIYGFFFFFSKTRQSVSPFSMGGRTVLERYSTELPFSADLQKSLVRLRDISDFPGGHRRSSESFWVGVE
jgi:hypothetical protein